MHLGPETIIRAGQDALKRLPYSAPTHRSTAVANGRRPNTNRLGSEFGREWLRRRSARYQIFSDDELPNREGDTYSMYYRRRPDRCRPNIAILLLASKRARAPPGVSPALVVLNGTRNQAKTLNQASKEEKMNLVSVGESGLSHLFCCGVGGIIGGTNGCCSIGIATHSSVVIYKCSTASLINNSLNSAQLINLMNSGLQGKTELVDVLII